MSEWCIGVDLGGTSIKFVALDPQSKAGEVFDIPTPDSRDALIEQIGVGVRRVMSNAGLSSDDVAGVGIGSPGPQDVENGINIDMPNISYMKNAPLRDLVSQEVNLPAVMENDANAAALGEYICGAGMGAKVLILVTLGTGVGSGIVIDGRIMHGANGFGGELGHLIVVPDGEQCGCGQRGCLEQYSSARFLAERTMRRIHAGDNDSLLADVLAEKGEINAKDINDARKAGDKLAAEMWSSGAYYLAMACVDLCRLFDPEAIVFAGGMAAAGEDLLVPIREHFRRLDWKLTETNVRLVTASLGASAGSIGAAGVARAKFVD